MTLRTLLSTVALVATLGVSAGLGLSACDGGAAALECVDNGDCSDGEACLLNACEPVQCLASAGCGIGESCVTETYVCRIGCVEDGDCRAGETCNTGSNTCESYGCRDTQLDCAIGESCNLVTGECVRDGRGHCDMCDPDPWGFDLRGTCIDRDAMCLTFDGLDFFCFQSCSDNNPCPRGYICDDSQDFDGDGRNDPNCAAYCPTLWDNGWK